jgi:hypothetical protein
MRAGSAIGLGAALLGAAALGAAGAWAVLAGPWVRAPEPAKPALSTEYPGGKPIDASLVGSGRLAVERLPEEVTFALEQHSTEIAKTAQLVEGKQARITGTCAPGSAIRVVGDDGSVVCQRLPRGVASVSALSGVTRVSGSGTAQGSVPGGVGRYQTSGEDDFLVMKLDLPDGAVLTGFAYVFWDASEVQDGAAYLYRSDDTVLAALATGEARSEVRMVQTAEIAGRKVDNSAFAYFVYAQLSAEAGEQLMPIAASVSYRLP